MALHFQNKMIHSEEGYKNTLMDLFEAVQQESGMTIGELAEKHNSLHPNKEDKTTRQNVLMKIKRNTMQFCETLKYLEYAGYSVYVMSDKLPGEATPIINRREISQTQEHMIPTEQDLTATSMSYLEAVRRGYAVAHGKLFPNIIVAGTKAREAAKDLTETIAARDFDRLSEPLIYNQIEMKYGVVVQPVEGITE